MKTTLIIAVIVASLIGILSVFSGSITFLIVLSLNFINCKQKVKVEAKSKDAVSSYTKMDQVPHLNNNWVAEMTLNNGTKWEANLETTTGVADMAKLIGETKTISVEDYRI